MAKHNDITVLVLDNEPDVAQFIADVLRFDGYDSSKVVWAHTPEYADEYLATHKGEPIIPIVDSLGGAKAGNHGLNFIRNHNDTECIAFSGDDSVHGFLAEAMRLKNVGVEHSVQKNTIQTMEQLTKAVNDIANQL